MAINLIKGKQSSSKSFTISYPAPLGQKIREQVTKLGLTNLEFGLSMLKAFTESEFWGGC